MIAIACDQGGFTLKQAVIQYLESNSIAYNDLGTYTEASTDYPIYAKKVAKAVLAGDSEKGIIICGTGIGVSIAANRFPGIRCALCHDVFSARQTRLHNDANILAMGGRVIGAGHALDVVDAFLQTAFSGDERHARRIRLIENETEQ